MVTLSGSGASGADAAVGTAEVGPAAAAGAGTAGSAPGALGRIVLGPAVQARAASPIRSTAQRECAPWPRVRNRPTDRSDSPARHQRRQSAAGGARWLVAKLIFQLAEL